MQLLESLGIEPIWAIRSILIVLALLGLASGLRFLLAALSKKVRFKKGSIKVPGFGDLDFEGKTLEENMDTRLSEVNMKMILAVVSKTVEITTKIVTVKIHNTISLQMRFTEERLLAMRREMLREYMRFMMDRCEDSKKQALSSHSDYQLYSALTSIFMYDMLQYLKESFLKNGFIHLSDAEYKEFLESKFLTMEARGSEFFDLMYTGEHVVSRAELVDIHKKRYVFLKEGLREIYDQARQVELSAKGEIDDLDHQLDVFIQKYLGATVEEASSVTAKG